MALPFDNGGKDIDPTPPDDEEGPGQVPEEEDEDEATVITGKQPMAGWMAILGCIIGAAVVAVAIAVSSPVLAAVGLVIALVSVTAWMVGRLAEYAISRPFRRAANALGAIYTAGAKVARGDFKGAGKTLATVEALDWFALLALLVLFFILARLLTGKLKRKKKK